MSPIKNTSTSLRLILTALAVFLALSSQVPANGYDTLYWLGTNGTTWTNGNNWSENSTSGDPATDFQTNAYINFSAISSNSTATDLGGDQTISSLTINSTDPVGISGGNLTVSGATTINSGTLTIGNGGTTGALIGDITNNGTLALNRSDDFTFSNNAPGTGTLLKLGSNTVTLNTTQSNTGGTIIDAGTLLLDGNNRLATSGNLSINAAGILNLGSNNQTLSTVALNGGNITGAGRLTANSSFAIQSGSVSALLAGTAQLVKTSNATFVLTGSNTYSGKTIVEDGTLSFDLSNASATAAQALGTNADFDLGAELSTSGTLNYTGAAATFAKNIKALGAGNNTVQNSGSGLLTLAGTLTKNGTILVLAGGTGGIQVNGAIVGSAENSDLILNGGNITLNATNTYNGPTYLNNGVTLTLAAANALPGDLIIDATSSVAFGVNQAIEALTGAAGSTIDLGSYTLTMGSNGTDSLYEGGIEGAGLVVKTGSNAITLSGTNTYNGTTTSNGGVLVFGTPTSLYNGDNSTWTGDNIIVNSGGAFALSVGANGSFSEEQAGSIFQILTSNATAGGILAGGSVGLDVTGDMSVDEVTADREGGGAVGFVKLGNGSLTLTGNNTYTGPTAIRGGTLALASSDLLVATGNLTVQGGTLALDANNQTFNQVTLASGSITGNGGTLTASGYAVQSGTATANLAGNATLAKTGTGTAILSGNNTYTGSTTISGGTLSFLNTSSLYGGNITRWNSGNISVATGSTISFAVGGAGAFSSTDLNTIVGNLTQNQTSAGGIAAGANIGLDTNGNDASISTEFKNRTGTGSGNLTLVKTGQGTLSLTGNNSYTGGTFIESGTLSGDSLGLKGNITNNGTLFLGTNGTYQIEVSGNGNLLVGNGANNILAGNATMTGGTTIQSGTLTIGGVIDPSSYRAGSLTGNVSNEGSLVFDLSSLAGTRTYNGIISGNGSLRTTFNGINYPSGANGTILLTGNNTFTGGTFVSVGTVDISSGSLASNGNVTISIVGIFAIGSSNQTIGLFLLNSQSAQATGAGTLTTTAENYDLRAGTVSLSLNGTAGLTKNSIGSGSDSYDNGRVYLSGNNTSTGNITISSGILSFDNFQSLYSGNNASWTKEKISVSANSTLALGTGNGTATDGFNNDQIADIFSRLTQNGTGGFVANSKIGLNTTSNFTLTTNITDRPDSGAIGMDKIGAGVLTLNSTNTFSGGLSIFEGVVALGRNNALLPTSDLVVNSKSSASYGFNVGNYTQQFVDITLKEGLLAGESGAFIATGNYTLIKGNATANLSGNASLIKTNTSGSSYNVSEPEIVYLSGNNSYTGRTIVDGAEWYGTQSPSPSSNSGAPTKDNAKLQFQTVSTLYSGNETLWTPENISVDSYGIFSLRTGSAGFNATQVSTIIQNLITANRSGTAGGFLDKSMLGIDTNGEDLVIDDDIGDTTSLATGGGAVGLIKYGNGTLTLNGNSTRSFSTSVTGGNMVLGSNATLSAASANLLVASALLDIATTNQTVRKVTVTDGSIIGTGTLTSSAEGFVFGTANITANLAGAVGATIDSATTLSGNNSFTGNTTINPGATLSLANVNALAGSTLAIFSNSGSLQFSVNGTNTYNLGGLTGTGNLSMGDNSLSIGANSQNTTYSAVLSGTGSITKVGNGTLTLSGNNTYSGGTTISGGTLEVSSTGQISHSASNLYAGFGSGDDATFTLNGGNVSGAAGFIGYGNGSAGTANINSGNWTSSLSMRVGYWGDGTLNLTGGNISNANGMIGKYGNSTGVANVSGGTWSTSGDMYVGDENSSTGTLNLTGGNVVVGGGGGNLTLAGEANATGTLNLGNGTTVGNLQAARVTAGNGTAIVNFNHSGNHSFSSIMEGNLTVNQIGTGTTTLSGNNTYTGGTFITSGTLEGNTQSLQGAITTNASVVFNQTSNGTYSGALSGSGEFAKTGAGTLTVSGNSSSFNGTAAINSGTVSLTGSMANAATTINSGATLSGTGTLGAVTINSGGTIAPGNSAGIITTGNMTWNGGGIYNWELASANGTAGTGWDLITSSGNLTINANAGDQFIINASTTNGSGFDPNVKNASWKIAEFAGGISGFDPLAFTINPTGFENLPSMYAFGITSNGTALNFSYATVATWIGGTGNWTNTADWENGALPLNGVTVDYAGTNGTSTNDSSVGNIGGLAFTNNSTGSFTLAGGALTIGTGGITNNSAFTNTVGMDLVLGANQTFAANTANLVVSGNISGNASLTKEGNETLTLSGSNTYTGETTIDAGTLAIASSGSLTGTSKILVGNSSSDNTLDILGTVSAGNMTLSEQGGSDNNTVTVGGGSSPASLTVSNLINVGFGGTGNTLDILGNGTVTAASTWIGGYGSNSTLNLTSGVLNSTSDVVVGYFADDNALNITAGGNATAGSVTLGLDAASANNTILVSGTGSALRTAGLIYLGDNGSSNTLAIENGGKVVSENLDSVIGFNAGSNGNALSINGTGSQLTNNGTLYVGQGGSENTLAIDNGGSLTTRNARIGHDATSSNNTATISGTGSTWANTGTLRVGSAGSNNTLAVTSGANVTVAGNTFIGHGAASENNLVSVEGTGSVLNLANATVGLDGSNNSLRVAGSGAINAVGIQLSGTNSTLQIGNGAAAGTLTTSLGIGTGTGTGHKVVFNHTDSNLAFSPILTGNLSVSQIGNGTTSLTADSIHTGGTTISAGTLSLGNGDTSGSVTGDISNNATLSFNRSDAVEYAGVVSGSGALVKDGNNTLTLSGSNTYSGGTTVNTGTLAGTTTSLQGAIANNAAVNFDQSTNGTYAGVMSGTGVLVKNGNNTLTLSGNNTYNGGTTVNSGTLAGTTTSLQGAIANSATVNFDQSTDGTYAGAMSGNGVLVKNGTGTVTMGGANSHTGGTTVNAGTLSVTGVLGSVSNNASFSVQQGGTAGSVTNQLGATATNSGSVASLANAGTFTNGGNITGNATTNGTLTSTGRIGGTLGINGGSATIGSGGQVVGASTVTAGTLDVSGSVASVSNSASLTVQQSGAAGSVTNQLGATATNNGTVASLTNLGIFTNSGNITGGVTTNGTLTSTGRIGGTLGINGGTATIGAEGQVVGSSTVTSGTLEVSGGVGSVSNNAIFTVQSGGTAGAVTNGGTGTNAGTVASLVNSGTFANSGNITGDTTTSGTLSSTGTLSGALAVSGGVTTINGTVLGATTLSGGVLQGTGALGALTINSGGAIAPGNSPGTITVGNSVWNGGGIYNWQLGSATGTAGTDWDLITSGGSLSINATSGEKFVINATALAGSGFDSTAESYKWQIANFSGNITGFSTEKFLINPAGFDGAAGVGAFSMSTNSTSLDLNYRTLFVWDAGNGTWSTDTNWLDNALPVEDAPIEFAGLGGTSTNDNYLTSISGLTFTANAGEAYTLAGGNLSIGAGGIVNNSNHTQTLGLNIALGADQTFAANTANLVVSGNIVGSHSLTKEGSQTLTLSGSNSYSGGTALNAGTLVGTTASLQGAIQNNATVVFDQSTNGTYAGNMGGTGSLLKNGSGVVTVSGVNSQAGGTVVNAGTLSVEGSIGGVTNNATLIVQQSGTAGSVANQVGATGSNNGTVASLANAGTFTNSGNITGSVTTNGTLTGNGQIGGTLEVNGGTATLGAGGQVSGATTVNSGSLAVGGTVVGVTNNATLTVQQGGEAGSVTNLFGASATNNGTVASLANAGTFTNSGNITGNVATNDTLTSTGRIGGTLGVDGGSATIGANGQVVGESTVNAGELTVGGTVAGVTNNATFTVQQGGEAGSVTNLIGASATNNGIVDSLANAGTFTNSGNITGSVTSNDTLTSTGRIGGTLGVDGGSATIGANGQVVGESTVNAGELTVGGTVAGVANNATLTVQQGGSAGSVNNLFGASATNNGIVSSLANAGTFTNSGNITGNATTNGTLTSTGRIGGTLGVDGGSATIGALGQVAGSTTVTAGTLDVSGTVASVTNNATLTVQQGGTAESVTNQIGATATNNGTVASLANAGTFTNSGAITGNATTDGTLSGSGSIGGTLEVAGGNATIGSGGQVLGATTVSTGTLQVDGTLADVSNSDTLTINQGGGAGAVTNLSTATNNGTVASLTNLGIFTNSGNITGGVTTNGTLTSTGRIGGTLGINGGTATIGAEGQVVGSSTVTVGSLDVSGSVAAVTNSAILNVQQSGTAGSVDNQLGATATNNGTVASLANAGTFINGGNIAGNVTTSGALSSSGSIGGALTIGGGETTISGTVVGATTITAGKLQGNGTLGALTLNSGGTIAPGTGNTTATLTVGNSTWNGGGIYNWELASVSGTAGSDWDLITSGGMLTLNATSANQISFTLSTLGNATLADVKKASWEVGSFEGGISGFEKKAFAFDPAGMTGNDGRYFMSLGANNTALILNYKSAATWITGSGNWTTDTQWEDEAFPENGDEVEFAGPGGTSTNNFAAATLSTISGFNFVEGAGAYTVNGNTLQIGEDGIINASTNLQTIGMDLTAGDVLTIDAAAAGIEISGVISGNSALTKNGSSTLTLSGNNSYSGLTTISAGTLALGGTAGAISGNISVDSGATFAVNRINEAIISNVISGAGSFAQVGSGVTRLRSTNNYTGGTTISEGKLWVEAPQALGTGSVTINGGKLLATSSQELIMGNQTLSIGGNLDWTGGRIAFFDTGSSPLAQDLKINVAGNFTVSTPGNATFDFSEVQALDSGDYTLVSTNGTVSADNTKFTAAHGEYTKLFGSFTTTNKTVVYTVTGAESTGPNIENNGGPNTPVVADYDVTQATITKGQTNIVNALKFGNNAPLAIETGGKLIVTSGVLNVQSGASVVSGGTVVTPGNFDKLGTGELDVQSNMSVNGTALVNAGLLSVNGQLAANEVVVDPTATLGGAGLIITQNVVVLGNLSPGNSPGTLSIAGNLVLSDGSSTVIEIASPTNFDRIVVSGQATLGGTLEAQSYEGAKITPGTRYDFLQAGSIVGEFDSIVVPDGLRGRFLNLGTVGALLFGPESFVPYALNPNQRNVAKALDSFVLATDGDAVTVGTALDSLTAEQFPAAFDQIMPGFYESLGDILIEQTYNQTQLLSQRLGTLRLGPVGFQAIGLSQPIKYDKDGKSTADAKTASPIVESAIDTNWNAWVMANGEFSISRGLAGVPNYNNNAGGFLVGADYRLSENFVAGLFAGYEYSYAKYNGGSSTRGNSALFGLYGSYTHEDGYYADAIVSGGYTGFQTRRSIEFGTIDRTARANPDSGQFSAALNLGKDFEIGKFTLGPIIGAQYTYAGIGGFTETGADSLDLALGQQNANSLRTNLGARLAYNWEVASNITLIPEVRGFWMHEFLNEPRNINSALEGGSGPSFDYETSAPYSNSVFGGAGISAKVGDRWSASVFYNVNFGAEGYTNNIISTSLGFSF